MEEKRSWKDGTGLRKVKTLEEGEERWRMVRPGQIQSPQNWAGEKTEKERNEQDDRERTSLIKQCFPAVLGTLGIH